MSNLPAEAARSKLTVLSDDVEPGSGGESDYGFTRQWFHPTASKRHRIWAFVMVLPDSRHRFVRPVVRMVQHAWTFAHVGAFHYFGGAPGRPKQCCSADLIGGSGMGFLVTPQRGR
ncbi:hypothetical protein ACFYYL_39935 [Actinomadura geliboluensis]|uniref:hypothetical protein n=1 Tax=Actinomadura geliboluensis TaxID=882440 RepID=UPI0036C1C57B